MKGYHETLPFLRELRTQLTIRLNKIPEKSKVHRHFLTERIRRLEEKIMEKKKEE